MTPLTADARERLSRTVCRFCLVCFYVPSKRREHEATCDLAWGDPQD